MRRSLARHLIGRRIMGVDLRRGDVVRGESGEGALLCGATVTEVIRHGKQLGILGVRGGNGSPGLRGVISNPCVCIHLGMTGSLRFQEGGIAGRLSTRSSETSGTGSGLSADGRDTHVHVEWELEGGGRVRFRDPRRFGGVWTFPGHSRLVEERWGRLGPDALRITSGELHARLSRTRRALKSVLLDQAVLAGLGNIYVDELLHVCGLHPLTGSDQVKMNRVRVMVRRMRGLLREAIAAGGSSFRDYQDANGERGGYQNRHRVYGRGGLACLTCGERLLSIQVAGRTTVFCDGCQRL